MQTTQRQFTDSPAVRSRVPLAIGLVGPSGGGKTFSALRMATGIQRVVGGDIYFVDTESRRALHYADDFNFRHVPFAEPFGSLDYLASLKHCVKNGAKVVIVDSMSHEHDGVGGMLDTHEQVLTRMAGDDYKKRESMKMLAWSEPKQARRQLLNGMLQLDCNFIFCFRAKDTAKPMRGANNKMEVVKMGFLPIAGPEFVYEMTLNCLLLPNANGVPTFFGNDLEDGEKMMIKLPRQFKSIFDQPGVQLTEDIGVKLAQWAAGDSIIVPTGGSYGHSPDQAALREARGKLNRRLTALSDQDRQQFKTWGSSQFNGLFRPSDMTMAQVTQSNTTIDSLLAAHDEDEQEDNMDDLFPDEQELVGAGSGGAS